MWVFPVTSQLSVEFKCQTFESSGEKTSCIATYILSECVLGTGKVWGSSSILIPIIYVQKKNSPQKNNYFGSLPLLPHFSIFKKVYTHVPQWFLLAWVIRNYDYLSSPSFHPDVALQHQRTQTIWQVSPQTAKRNGLAANRLAPFPMGWRLKSSSDNKWSESLLWPDSHLCFHGTVLSSIPHGLQPG